MKNYEFDRSNFSFKKVHRSFLNLLRNVINVVLISACVALVTQGRADLAKKAKQLDLDAIHDAVHEIGRDEARHGKAFAGLLKRYFG